MKKIGLVLLYATIILLSQLIFGRTPQEVGVPQAGVIAGPSMQEQIAAKQRDLDARVQAMMFQYDCTTPGTWKQDHPNKYDFPKTMVVKPDKTWGLRLKTWTIPAPAHTWVMLLCANDPPG